MLTPVVDLPAGVVGLRANGTVIARDISQALALAKTAMEAGKNVGFILFVDPDLDGYLSEIVSGLGVESQANPAVLGAAGARPHRWHDRRRGQRRPALKQADIGVAVSGAPDAARAAAALILIAPGLSTTLEVVGLRRPSRERRGM